MWLRLGPKPACYTWWSWLKEGNIERWSLVLKSSIIISCLFLYFVIFVSYIPLTYLTSSIFVCDYVHCLGAIIELDFNVFLPVKSIIVEY